ncbi:hypothetical protein Bca52824_027121 [Brassica carinata]|uniref:Reverse transcriptase zinc-binding domain-containing protein n=1 Tax=Brassica carinata TaxID=52824 RepID=A0A8X7SHU2_BRACI|nr:hypothetical protein Bca52824_027121 [Brassica carinata]
MENIQRYSPTVKAMIRIRPTVVEFLRCQTGDGRSATFWFDWWTDMGPLLTALGIRGPRDLRLSIDSKVVDATANGQWALPPARSDEAETLQIVLSTMTPPNTSLGKDTYLWRNGADHFVPKFSTKATWNRIRVAAPLVSWSSMIWFREEIPRCSFVTWLAIQGRLPTRDRLLRWGMTVPNTCPLCSSGIESHSHLFFGCSYASGLWSRLCGQHISAPPLSLMDVSEHLDQAPFSSSSGLSSVLKLLLQVLTYCLWRERNSRIFRQTPSSEAALFAMVDRLVRDRLLSFPAVSVSRPSLLHLYFSFFSND